jgi:hypothetical protein
MPISHSEEDIPEARNSVFAQLPDPQVAALHTEIQRHDQALYLYGEYVYVVMLWHVKDAEANNIPRCSRCYLSQGAIADTYKQASDSKCPDCFGTTWEGGYRARVVRPMLIAISTDDDVAKTPRGEETPSGVSIQLPSDIRPRHGDYIFRGDGIRWIIDNPALTPLHTGFGIVNATNSVLGYLNATVRQEAVSSVAYIIPPDPHQLVESLTLFAPRVPKDFSEFEDIRGPLIV